MVLITGGTGFVGLNLQKYLENTHEVNSISVRYNLNQNFHFDADSIVHLAGKAHDLKKVSLPNDYYEANYKLTKQIFDAFIISNANTFIYISSVKAVADSVENVLTEECIANPITHYGKSKLLAEEYITSVSLPENKKVYILRPSMIHGQGNKGNLNLLYKVVKMNLPYPLGAFDNKRSFLSIGNLNFIIKELIDRNDVLSGIYNVSDDVTISTKEIILIMSDVLHKKAKVWYINKSLINFLAKLGNTLKLPINQERLQKLTENYIVSNDKIKGALKKELPLSSEKGMRLTIESFTNEK